MNRTWKHRLHAVIAICFLVAIAMALPQQSALASAIADYNMDESSGNIVYDGSGNSHEGIAYNANIVTGHDGNCRSFTKSPQGYITFGNLALPQYEGTIEMWIKPRPRVSSQNHSHLFVKGNNGSSASGFTFYLRLYDDGHLDAGRGSYGSGISWLATDPGVVSFDDAWQHISFSWSDTETQWSVNGDVVATGGGMSVGQTSHTVALCRWGDQLYPETYYEGEVDELRILDTYVGGGGEPDGELVVDVIGEGQPICAISLNYLSDDAQEVSSYSISINGVDLSNHLETLDESGLQWIPLISFYRNVHTATISAAVLLHDGSQYEVTKVLNISSENSFPATTRKLPLSVMSSFLSMDYPLEAAEVRGLAILASVIDVAASLSDGEEEIALLKSLDYALSSIPGIGLASYPHSLFKDFALTDLDCRELDEATCNYLKEGFVISDIALVAWLQKHIMLDVAELKMGYGPGSSFTSTIGSYDPSYLPGNINPDQMFLSIIDDMVYDMKSLEDVFVDWWESFRGAVVFHTFSPIDLQVHLGNGMTISKASESLPMAEYEERVSTQGHIWEDQVIILIDSPSFLTAEIIIEPYATADSVFSITARRGSDTLKFMNEVMVGSLSEFEFTISTFDTGSIAGTVTVSEEGLFGVPVGLCDSDGMMVASAVTDDMGQYLFGGLDNGLYSVSIAAPLGYSVDVDTKEIEVQGLPHTVDFDLTQVDIPLAQRGRGYWMHQVNAHLSGKGKAHETLDEMCGYMESIRTHFNDHGINPVNVFAVDLASDCDSRLSALRTVISPRAKASVIEKAQAHLTAALLNMVSGKIAQWSEVSEDGATLSQAITFCNSLIIDADPENDDRAKDIAEMINDGEIVPAGWIDLATPDIAYKHTDNESLPTEFVLHQNYPNPFNPTTEISFSLPERVDVRLEIFNVTGQAVATLFDGSMEAGEHQVVWDASAQATGVYLYRLTTGTFTDTKKMILIK